MQFFVLELIVTRASGSSDAGGSPHRLPTIVSCCTRRALYWLL